MYETITIVGKAYGLWIMWDPIKFDEEIIHYSSNICLSMKITFKSSKYTFIMSNIYASNILSRRR